MQPGNAALPVDVRGSEDDAVGSAVLMDAVLDALPSPTLLLDRDGTVLLANAGWSGAAEVLGPGLPVDVGSDYYALAGDVRDGAGHRSLVGVLGELSRGERDAVTGDYQLPLVAGARWFHLQASRVDQAGHIVVTHTDVTSRVHAERTLSWQARHDHLTELPNRAYLHELIAAELQRPDRPAVAVLFLDVDGFKDVNDTLGHEVGDDLLRQIARRLLSATRAEDTVGRLGGDEFVVLCRSCDAEGAELLAGRLRGTFDPPFDLGGRTVRLGASIGIAAAGPEAAPEIRSTDLVRDADLAMYAAKGAGRNRVHVFSPDLRSAAEHGVTLAAELREAIDAGELVLHYQPVMYLPTRQCTGVEALVRWQHPERGLLPPADFLPTAEQHDLMTSLTRWVLTEAARQTADWNRGGLHLVTGVNIDAGQLAGTLVDDVLGAVAAAGLAPEQLGVELTEASVAQEADRAAVQFADLRRRGVEVSIDDFGRGYSSLTQLVSIPAGVLKIDPSLIAGPDGGQAEAAIAAVVALGQACGIRSLAEGVETADQLAMVGELGCTFAQGFHIARPMPAAEVAAWMAAHQRGAEAAAGRANGQSSRMSVV